MSVISAAQRVACVADAQSLSSAISDYELFSGNTLGRETGVTVGHPSTYAKGHGALILLRARYVSSWPQDSAFAISLSTETSGDVAVYVPAASRHPVIFSGEGPTTGCNAL
jgi:hypothetical protein